MDRPALPRRCGGRTRNQNPEGPTPFVIAFKHSPRTPTPTPPSKVADTPSPPSATVDKPNNGNNKNNSEPPKSEFQKTVCLADWWLVKAENGSQGKRLAVAGFTSREQQAMRVFSSAPILKIYDIFTLETTDGVCVIIEGLMNKARTMENGFPSEVCKHFIFGFPPYWEEYAEKCWEEYAEKCMAEVFPSNDVSEDNTVQLSPRLLSAAGTRDSRTDISKQQQKFVGEGTHVDSPQDVDTSSVISNASECPERESSFGDRIIENQRNSESSGCVIGNRSRASATSLLGETIPVSNIVDKDVNSPGNHKTTENYISKKSEDNTGRKRMFSCHSHKQSRHRNAFVNQKGEELDDYLFDKAKFGKDISSLEEIVKNTEGGAVSSSIRKLERRRNDEQVSPKPSADEKIISDSVSLVGLGKIKSGITNPDGKSGATNRVNLASSECKEPTRATNSESYVDSVKDKIEQEAKISMQHENCRSFVLRSFTAKASTKWGKKKTKSSSKLDGRKIAVASLNNISGNAKASGTDTKRELTYGTPKKEKENVAVDSSLSLSFRRSRSAGRLLMPTLEFWRNQRVIYDVDRTVTGIVESLNLGQQVRGSLSEPQRKRRQL